MNAKQRRTRYRKLVAQAKAVGVMVERWRMSEIRLNQLIREANKRMRNLEAANG